MVQLPAAGNRVTPGSFRSSLFERRLARGSQANLDPALQRGTQGESASITKKFRPAGPKPAVGKMNSPQGRARLFLWRVEILGSCSIGVSLNTRVRDRAKHFPALLASATVAAVCDVPGTCES